MKSLFYTTITFMCLGIHNLYALSAKPPIECGGLPGCKDGADGIAAEVEIEGIFATIISETIKYVAVCAVIALMISGIMYMLSQGVEEKTEKAKKWIIYSMIAVVLSMLSWFIITTLNTIQI